MPLCQLTTSRQHKYKICIENIINMKKKNKAKVVEIFIFIFIYKRFFDFYAIQP